MSHEFVVITSGQVAPNAPVDTTLMSGIKNDLDFFNNQSTTAGSGLNNAGTALSPILDVKTASGIQIVDDTLLLDGSNNSRNICQVPEEDTEVLTPTTTGSTSVFTSKFYVPVSGTFDLNFIANLLRANVNDVVTGTVDIDDALVATATSTSLTFLYETASGTTVGLSVGFHTIEIKVNKTTDVSGAEGKMDGCSVNIF